MSRSGIVLKLQKKMNHSSNDQDYVGFISKTILKNLNSLEDDFTVSELADLCLTSTATISRYVKDLGYSSFNELRAEIQNISYDYQELEFDLNVERNSKSLDTKKTTNNLVKEIIYSFEQFLETFNYRDIEELSRLIHSKKRVVLFGTQIPGNICEILQYNLLLCGKFVEFYPDMHDQINCVNELDQDSLAIVLSLEGSFVTNNREVTFGITQNQITSVLITQNPTMKYNEHFNFIVDLKDHDSVRSGKFKLMLFVELLSQRYIYDYGASQ